MMEMWPGTSAFLTCTSQPLQGSNEATGELASLEGDSHILVFVSLIANGKDVNLRCVVPLGSHR